MKKLISIAFFITTLVSYTYGQDNTYQFVDIPDEEFKKVLLSKKNINKNNDEEISYAEAASVDNNLYIKGKHIQRLKGIEAFVNIKKLYCYGLKLKALDLSHNNKLEYLYCGNNQLTALSLPDSLKTLDCEENQLETLTLPDNLKTLHCDKNQLTVLTLPDNLKTLYCDENQLTALSLPENIETLDCKDNQLTHLVLNKNLNEAECSNNKLESITLNKSLSYLTCNNNKLTSLELNENLRSLQCSSNQLTSIKPNDLLSKLHCNNNQIKSFTVKPWMYYLHISNNGLEQLDLSSATHLEDLDCSSNNLTKLNINTIPSNHIIEITCNDNDITFLDISKAKIKLLNYDKSKVQLKESRRPKYLYSNKFRFDPELGYKFKYKNNLKLGLNLGWYTYYYDDIAWGGSVNINHNTNFRHNNIFSAGARLNYSIVEASANFSMNEIEPTIGIFYKGIRANVGYSIPKKNNNGFDSSYITYTISIASKEAFSTLGLLGALIAFY